MISGYLLGFPYDTHPRTPENLDPSIPSPISSRVFDRICPKKERYIVDVELARAHAVKEGMIDDPKEYNDLSGRKLLDVWVSMLDSPGVKDQKCVETRWNTMPIFDIWFFGSWSRMLDLWDTLVQSPTMKNLGWSKLILQTYAKNIQFFATKKDLKTIQPPTIHKKRAWDWLAPEYASSNTPSQSSHQNPYHFLNHSSLPTHLSNDTAPLPLLVLHVRRGDFKDHCMNLAEWSSTYNAINAFPEFAARDKFVVPKVNEHRNGVVERRNVSTSAEVGLQRRYADPTEVSSMAERKAIYARHCFPDAGQIVQRVRDVVKDYHTFVESSNSPKSANQRMKKVYIMTNGDKKWLNEVKEALMEDARKSSSDTDDDDKWGFVWKWEDVASSRDLDLGYEEKPVAQTLDLYVASRAELFVGNGFSSLTSNIVMLRKRNGLDAVQTRFW